MYLTLLSIKAARGPHRRLHALPLALASVLPGLSACTSLRPGGDHIRMLESPAQDVDAASDAARHETPLEGADAAEDAQDAGLPCPRAGERRIEVLDHQELTEDTELGCQFDYEVRGHLLVSAGTLTVREGVTVRAQRGAFVLVGRAARIDVQGTAEAPVVFTASERPAQPGAWGGIFLLGAADTALANNASIALPAGDPRAYYGGEDDEHDCGSLRYMRVEFAGGPANEYDFPAAALTFAGCGRATQVDHVQVHAATDGIGLIGGTVPLKRVLVSAAGADGIEWAAGYRGLVQFAIVQTFHGAGAALKGSRSEGDQTTPPASAPVIFNATLAGARAQGLASAPADPNGFETGLLLQAGTRAQVYNSLIYGFAGPWVDVIGEATAGLVGMDTRVESSVFAAEEDRTTTGLPRAGEEPGDGEDDDGGLDEHAALHASSLHNRFPSVGFRLEAPFAPPPARPAFSADGFVDGGTLRDTAPEGFRGQWEAAFYAGALPKIQGPGDRALDFTREGPPGRAWTDFPAE